MAIGYRAAGLAALGCACLGGTAIADEHESPGMDAGSMSGMRFTPVQTYTCNYNDGKGPADLDAAIGKYTAFLDEIGDEDYFAMTVTPRFHGPDTFDVGWLGTWPDGDAMGAGLDVWVNAGSEYAQAFGEVVTCDSHSMYASTELKAPPEGPPPDRIVLAFSDCNVPNPDDWENLMAALGQWVAHMESRGYEAGEWMMFPVLGGGGAEYDFKHVTAWDSYSTMGMEFEMYGTGGDWMKHGELTGDMLQCDDARVYDGRIVRRPGGGDGGEASP